MQESTCGTPERQLGGSGSPRASLSSGVLVGFGDMVFDDRPVEALVQAHADPTTRSDVGRSKVHLGLALDKDFLDSRRCGQPDGQASVTVMVVEEGAKLPPSLDEEARRTVAHLLHSFGQGQATGSDGRQSVIGAHGPILTENDAPPTKGWSAVVAGVRTRRPKSVRRARRSTSWRSPVRGRRPNSGLASVRRYR